MALIRMLPQFRCSVTLQDGKLRICYQQADGKFETDQDGMIWRPIKGPASQEFVHAVNEALGTQFRVEDFKSDS